MATPNHIEAAVADDLGLWRPVPRDRHPPLDTFAIAAIVSDLALATVNWRRALLEGYFRDSQP